MEIYDFIININFNEIFDLKISNNLFRNDFNTNNSLNFNGKSVCKPSDYYVNYRRIINNI